MVAAKSVTTLRLVTLNWKALKSARDLSLAVLESTYRTITNGQVDVRRCFYGMGASVSGEYDKGAEALKEFINDGGTGMTVVL